MSAIYGYLFYVELKKTGEERYVPAFMLAITSVIVFFQALRNANGVVFGFADYETTCALPIKNRNLVFAKLTYVYLENLICFILFVFPASVIYGVLSKEGVAYYLRSVVGILLSPLFPAAAGLAVGTVVALFASKFKKSNLLNVVLSFVLVAAYMAFVFMTSNDNVEMVTSLALKVSNVYPVADLYANGIVGFNALDFWCYIFLSIAVLCVYVFLISTFYSKINAAVTYKKSSKGKVGELKSTSSDKTLFKREIGKWVNTPSYVLNSAMGAIMLIIMSVVVVIKLNGITELDKTTQTKGYETFALILNQLKAYIPLIPIVCTCTCCYCASSISIEGKSVWIIKSLPINPKEIFKAKIRLNLFITVLPTIAACVLFGIVLKLNAIEIILCVAASVSYCVTSAMFGLFVNVKKHDYDWQSAAEVIKRGAASTICVLVGLFACLPICLILACCSVLAIITGIPAMYICFVVLLIIFNVLNVILGKYLSGKGVTDFLKN